jgi:Type VI secretion system, TssN
MEKVIANDMTKFLFILGLIWGGASVLLAKLIEKYKGSFKPYQKATIWYMVFSFLLFSIIGLAAFPGLFDNPTNYFIFLQVYFFLLGLVHFYSMHQRLRWSGDPEIFWIELLFTVLICILGSIGFLIVYRLLNKDGLQYIMTGSMLLFIIPLIFYHTFRKAIAIPPKIMKEWFYPVNEEIDEPEESKMKNLLVISFEFQKQIQDAELTNFRAKAPTDMEFGQLFYYFINDYNERHPNSRISFLNPKGEPHGWIFYKKSNWYTVITNYISADKTIFNNHIKENDVIICTRSMI